MRRREVELIDQAADLILSIHDTVTEIDKLEKAYVLLTDALEIMRHRLIVDMLSILNIDRDA